MTTRAVRHSSSGRFDYLDGIRGMAILAVVIVHWGLGRTTIGRGGFVAVDVFFVLSGFVITTLLWRSSTLTGRSLGSSWVTFVRARIRRLYPALLGLVGCGSVLMLLIPGTSVPAGEVARNAVLTLLQVSWYTEMLGTIPEPSRQTWSLGVEWLFYLTWPVVVLLARSRGVSPLALAWWSLGSGVLLVAASTAFLTAEAFYFAPPGRFGQILIGAALALAFVHAPPEMKPRRTHTVITALGLGAIVVFALAGAHPFSDVGRLIGSPMALVIAVLLIHHGYAVSSGPVHLVMSSRPVALLGRVSYSLYLWHWIPIYLLDKDKIPLPEPVLAVLGGALATALTTASYLLLERPFISTRRATLAPQRTAPEPAPLPSAPQRTAPEPAPIRLRRRPDRGAQVTRSGRRRHARDGCATEPR